jgi:hypothetical protein
MVDCEIQDRKPGRESFELKWGYDLFQDQFPGVEFVRMKRVSGETTWWAAVVHEV